MCLYAGEKLQSRLLSCFKCMLRTGSLELTSQETVFTLLPKSGSYQDVNSWRPIARLRMAFNIFAKLPFARIQPTLDAQQAADQVGFRPEKL